MADKESYDYVVIGGGTAGSVLAARLSEDPNTRVVLLEAGASEGPEGMYNGDSVSAIGLWNSSVDWAYSTTPQAGTEGFVHKWPRGKVLGGSSSINGMMHDRGHRSGYDAWEKQGATRWNYTMMLPFLKRSESAQGRDPRERGTDGPMLITSGPPPGPLSRASYDAAVEAGYPACEDGNGTENEGVSWSERNVVAGRRQSAADAYLRPALSRPNLTVITGAHVRRLLLAGTRCHGAEYVVGGEVRTVCADREVILSAGAIGSPQILMLSGIGPARHLRDLGIDVVVDLPGVGWNLHDHPLSWVTYAAKQPVDADPSTQARVIARSAENVDPDLLISFVPAAMELHWSGARPDGYSIFFSLVSPVSRGSLRLQSADPTVPPVLNPAYLADDWDLDRMVAGMRLARAIGESDALAPWRAAELLPGDHVRDDDAARDYIRRSTTTYFHPVGTCRIGTAGLAVVDPLLRVHGVDGLRVADASVMPSIVSAPTNAAVLGIAERAARLVVDEATAESVADFMYWKQRTTARHR
ncbi:GMC family oxidoreductase N-terminal domain-containing protein [Nonomuraea sp. B12E4]|uniref:GMC family oxidoreductase n=1 Tax=Nonomuraea sp. B12E4 TaxID=3153564 RepID=UPI00325DA5FD